MYPLVIHLDVTLKLGLPQGPWSSILANGLTDSQRECHSDIDKLIAPNWTLPATLSLSASATSPLPLLFALYSNRRKNEHLYPLFNSIASIHSPGAPWEETLSETNTHTEWVLNFCLIGSLLNFPSNICLLEFCFLKKGSSSTLRKWFILSSIFAFYSPLYTQWIINKDADTTWQLKFTKLNLSTARY